MQWDPVHKAFIQYEGGEEINAPEGKRQRRSKYDQRYTYNYDPFIVWSKGVSECNAGVYNDRLWSDARLPELSKKYFPKDNPWGNRLWDEEDQKNGMVQMNAMLSELWGKKIEVVRIDEHCGANGFAYFNILYIDHTNEKRFKMGRPGE